MSRRIFRTGTQPRQMTPREMLMEHSNTDPLPSAMQPCFCIMVVIVPGFVPAPSSFAYSSDTHNGAGILSHFSHPHPNDPMSDRKRKGMLIKNTNTQTVTIDMATRTISLSPGEEELVTAEEVLDATLRDFLQVRGVSIVRPALDEEEAELKERLS